MFLMKKKQSFDFLAENIGCEKALGDDLKKHDCLFTNPVKNYNFIL